MGNRVDDLKTAYDILKKSRVAYETWIRNVINGLAVADLAEGFRLAGDCQKKLQDFMHATAAR